MADEDTTEEVEEDEAADEPEEEVDEEDVDDDKDSRIAELDGLVAEQRPSDDRLDA